MPLEAQGTASVSNNPQSPRLFLCLPQQLVNKMQFTGALAKTSNIALHLTNTYHLKGNTIDAITVNFGEDWLRVCY